MLRIGLTSGIGSGKTTVAEIFRVLGIPVFDADSETKKLMAEDEALRKNIITHFGEKSYVNNLPDRKFIAEQVFEDAEKLALLNSVMHPAAIDAAAKWFIKQDAPYAIKEAALLFEAGSTVGLDYIIGVYAPQHLRIKRVMQRNASTREEVISRMNRQIDEEIKIRLCDFVIVNDEQQLITPQVMNLHKKFLSLL